MAATTNQEYDHFTACEQATQDLAEAILSGKAISIGGISYSFGDLFGETSPKQQAQLEHANLALFTQPGEELDAALIIKKVWEDVALSWAANVADEYIRQCREEDESERALQQYVHQQFMEQGGWH